MNRTRAQVATLLLAVLALPALSAAQTPAAPVLQVTVTGQTVAGSWNAVAGATGYRVEVGLSPPAKSLVRMPFTRVMDF